MTDTIRRIIQQLTYESRAWPPARFPLDLDAAGQAGMYSWWADDHARTLIGDVLGIDIPPMTYVGQAGATRWPSGKRSGATLATRIGRNHIKGNVRSSTFRRTISAMLVEPLGLEVESGRLSRRSNDMVSVWIREHLRVAIAVYPDRDSLQTVENEVVKLLDPPLNLELVDKTPSRACLSQLRTNFRRRGSSVGMR